MGTTTLDLIEIAWEGPYDADQVALRAGPTDYGLIAIFGSHPVFGADALLYVDEAREQPFADRARRVRPWHKHLPSAPAFYLGRLGSAHPDDHAGGVTHDEWLERIHRAYRLMLFFHAPPWNARGVDHHGVEIPTVVLNVGRRHRLQLEVSTLWDQCAWDPDGSPWRPFAPPT